MSAVLLGILKTIIEAVMPAFLAVVARPDTSSTQKQTDEDRARQKRLQDARDSFEGLDI